MLFRHPHFSISFHRTLFTYTTSLQYIPHFAYILCNPRLIWIISLSMLCPAFYRRSVLSHSRGVEILIPSMWTRDLISPTEYTRVPTRFEGSQLCSTLTMSSRRQSPTPRRVVPIKRADGEPLTRSDIQYDLLSSIFTDTTDAFTNPWKDSKSTCFRDLYVDAITHSPKATKALKDKVSNSPVFATSFAMLSLLVNVGRINTTMSC